VRVATGGKEPLAVVSGPIAVADEPYYRYQTNTTSQSNEFGTDGWRRLNRKAAGKNDKCSRVHASSIYLHASF
jgi:hypothetical protein